MDKTATTIAKSSLHIEAFREYFREATKFSVSDITQFYQKFEETVKRSTVDWRIYKLKSEGIIHRLSRGNYSLSEVRHYVPSVTRENKLLYTRFKAQFPFAEGCYWDTKWINEFMLHQPAWFFSILEVEREVMESVLGQETYLNPSDEIIDKYITSERFPLIILPLVSEAPTQEIAIASPFVKTDEPAIKVTVPMPEAILGDKLTAYAPTTTGIRYEVGKEVEIIKQLFDVGHLFSMVNNMKTIASVFEQLAKTELAYRATDASSDDVLEDIIQTGIVICTRGKSGEGDFDQLQLGIKNIRNFIFSERFHIEKAIVLSARASYLAALIRVGGAKINRFTEPGEIAAWMIEQPFETRLNKLKKSSPEDFFYWYQTAQLISPAK